MVNLWPNLKERASTVLTTSKHTFYGFSIATILFFAIWYVKFNSTYKQASETHVMIDSEGKLNVYDVRTKTLTAYDDTTTNRILTLIALAKQGNLR